MGEFIFEIKRGSASITKYVGSGGDVTIPFRTPEGFSVKEIGCEAFRDCKNLTGVVIPEGVESIGNAAFWFCEYLSKAILPKSLRHIGEYAFINCNSLTDIVIPDGVLSIDREAFAQCASLTSVKLPQGITSVSDALFRNCEQLTHVVIPQGVLSIRRHAFMNCEKMKSVNLPDSLAVIESGAFMGCKALEVTLPKSVVSVYPMSFQGVRSVLVAEDHPTLTSLEGTVVSKDQHLLSFSGNANNRCTVPEGVTTIISRAFWDQAFTHVTLPDTLKVIEDLAFRGCDKLAEIVIPEGTVSIGDGAFIGCTGLRNVQLPVSLAHIGKNAFSGCHQAVFTVPEQSYALSYCREKGFPYRYTGRDEVFPVRADEPQAYAKTKVNQLNMFLLYAAHCFDGANSCWNIYVSEYDASEEQIEPEILNPEERIGLLLRKILKSGLDISKRERAETGRQEIESRFLSVLHEIGAEIHDFTIEGRARFDQDESPEIIRYDAFLIHVCGLWFAADLNWSD